MSRPRVLKREVPIDDEWHRLDVGTDVLHVDYHQDAVALWYLEPTEDEDSLDLFFRVYGTGHPIDLAPMLIQGRYIAEVPRYVGTAIDHARGLVWHVMVR